MNSCGIYTITNQVDGKMYVGYSKHINRRKHVHLKELRRQKHSNPHLQNAWNKYGEESFLFEVLVECEEEHLASEENYWCNLLNVHDKRYGYNERGTSPTGSAKCSEYSKYLMSLKRKGVKKSPEHIESMRRCNIGRKMSPEARKKMSDTRKGKPANPKAIETLKIVNEQIRLNSTVPIGTNKLAAYQVIEIKKRLVNKNLGDIPKIAQEYNVSRQIIKNISTGKSWKCIKLECEEIEKKISEDNKKQMMAALNSKDVKCIRKEINKHVSKVESVVIKESEEWCEFTSWIEDIIQVLIK